VAKTGSSEPVEGLEGLLLVDKPEGPTSHRVVATVRRLTGQRRVGHAGTLDPMATGLLPLVLGRATRLVRFLPHSPKAYEGRIRLGLTTSTDDVTGEVRSRHEGPWPAQDDVLRAAEHFTGRLQQIPPEVSARKVAGQRLYRLARQGRPVLAPAREVEIGRFDLTPTDDPAEWRFVAEVSAGTYLRALARDLGESLGTGGALSTLRRVAIGPLSVSEAVGLPGVGEGPEGLVAAVVPLGKMPLTAPPVRLPDPAAVRLFLSGGEVDVDEPPQDDGACRVLDGAGELLGIAAVTGRRARPKVVVGLARDPSV
jgi:tRNA pseudouridine55 synthase